MATATSPIVARGIDCICYLAKEFPRAKAFYIDVLGLRPSQEGEDWTEFELEDGAAFAIAKMPNDQWYPTGGVMFQVDDVAAALEKIRVAGTKIYTEALESPMCTTAWCEDTEGNNFALHKRKE